MQKTHNQYLCTSCHEQRMRRCRTELEGIKASYNELMAYCTESQKDVNDAAVALHQARKRHYDLTHDHEQDQKRMFIQMRGITLQTQARNTFIRHILQASKRHDTSALARITAGIGVQHRFELEKKASKNLSEKVFDIEGGLMEAEAQLKNAGKHWGKACRRNALLSKVQLFSCNGKSRLDSFLSQEEERGVKLWADLREQETAKVASKGLKELICQACNGWRWNDAKAPLYIQPRIHPSNLVATNQHERNIWE